MKKLLQNRKRIIQFLIICALLGIIFCILILLHSNKVVSSYSEGNIFDINDELPQVQAIMILGSRVYANGKMSDILKDRVDTAIRIYKRGDAPKILMSGDNGQETYDEVNTVRTYLIAQGIPAEDIFLDHAGFDTYDSMYRARDIFKVNSLLISTQDFHLPRAIYLAQNLGIEAYGVSADRHEYIGVARSEFREKLARVKAWFNIVLKSQPKYLGEEIPITGDGRATWDEK